MTTDTTRAPAAPSVSARVAFEPAPLAALTRLSLYPWLVVAVTCIGAFIGQVDASIVQLALPALEQQFGAPLSVVTWVAIGYQLAFAASLPIFARLAEISGRKLMYLLGFAVFAVASLLCGLATSLPELIGFRILLGLSGATLGANSVVILVKSAGPDRQGDAMGIFAAAQAIGVSVGPVIGGVLLAELGWRWVFWVTVPFGIVAAIAGWLVVPKTEDVSADRRFDVSGALLLMPALTVLLLLISESAAWGLTSPPLIGCAVATLVLLCAFVWRESRAPAPLIALSLFRHPAFARGIVAIVMSYALLYSMFFLMSFALVRGYHDAPLNAGLRLAIIPVALGLVAPFTGVLATRYGVPTLLLGGMGICLLATLILARVMDGTPQSLWYAMGALALFGAGLGLFIAPNNSETMSAAPADHRGQAGGLLNLMRVFGTSVGVACASAALSFRLAHHSGVVDRTLGISQHHMLAAIADGLWVVIGFAVIAGLMSLPRGAIKADAARA